MVRAKPVITLPYSLSSKWQRLWQGVGRWGMSNTGDFQSIWACYDPVCPLQVWHGKYVGHVTVACLIDHLAKNEECVYLRGYCLWLSSATFWFGTSLSQAPLGDISLPLLFLYPFDIQLTTSLLRSPRHSLIIAIDWFMVTWNYYLVNHYLCLFVCLPLFVAMGHELQ